MVAENDNMGFIDSDTQPGTRFEVDDKMLEFCGLDALGNVAYRKDGATKTISLDAWNAEIAPNVTGRLFPRNDVVTLEVVEEPAVNPGNDEMTGGVEPTAEQPQSQNNEDGDIDYKGFYRIQQELGRKSERKRQIWEDLKTRTSDAKKAYDTALEELQQHSIEEPQFPAMREPAKPADESSTPVEPIGTDDDLSWKSVPLASLIDPEIKPGVLKALLENDPSITTMGELVDWQAAKGDFWAKDISGVGTSAQDSIAEATFAFWTRWNEEKTKDAEVLAKAQS